MVRKRQRAPQPGAGPPRGSPVRGDDKGDGQQAAKRQRTRDGRHCTREQRHSAEPAPPEPGQRQAPHRAPPRGEQPRPPNGQIATAQVQRLHREILDFAEAAEPTPAEQQRREDAFRAVEAAVAGAIRECIRIVRFGSAAVGLELRSSDIDVVIIGLMQPDALPEGGFRFQSKRRVNRYLEAVKAELLARRVVRKSLIISTARIPVLKVTMAGGVDVDISVNDQSGLEAAAFVRKHLVARPFLRPLALALKALLRSRGLGDVSRGGLGSYALFNALIAHLLEEEKAGRGVSNLGLLMLGFLRRFGQDFDYERDAVAVAQGGIVSKGCVPGAAMRNTMRLCVEEPHTGRDISAGTHAMKEVRAAFAEAFDALEAALRPAVPGNGILSSILPPASDLDCRPMAFSAAGNGAREPPSTGSWCRPAHPRDWPQARDAGPLCNPGRVGLLAWQVPNLVGPARWGTPAVELVTGPLSSDADGKEGQAASCRSMPAWPPGFACNADHVAGHPYPSSQTPLGARGAGRYWRPWG